MKKLLMLLVLAGMMPLASMAQDDVYFTPSKVKESPKANQPAYYSGSNRSVDDYNRYGKLNSWYQKIGVDSLGNDIITFKGPGIKPDTSYVDTAYVYPGSASYDNDYSYTRRMSRWDGYYDPWLYDYYWRYGGWYDPYFNPWYYSWYGGWYDPWFGYYGYYSPWYYSYYGWGWPYYHYGWYGWDYPYWGGGYAYHGGHNSGGYSGQRTWTAGRNYTPGSSTNRGSRSFGNYTNRSASNRSFGSRTYGNSNRTYTPSTSGTTRSYGGFSGGSTGGSFGGGHSVGGGGSFGGGHAGGGGGHFGGGRR